MRKIKLIKQHDEKDCGVACLSMVLNFYDTSVPISKLRLMSGTNSQGTSAFGLVQALNNFQFQTQVFQTDGSIWKEKALGLSTLFRTTLYRTVTQSIFYRS